MAVAGMALMTHPHNIDEKNPRREGMAMVDNWFTIVAVPTVQFYTATASGGNGSSSTEGRERRYTQDNTSGTW